MRSAWLAVDLRPRGRRRRRRARPRCRRATRPATPEAAQDAQHRLDVADARHVAHDDLVGRSGPRRRGSAGRRSCSRRGRPCRDSGTPPSMTNFSMSEGRRLGGQRRSARLTAMSVQLSRDEAWALLTEWVAVGVPAPALPGGRGGDARLRARAAARTRSCGASSGCCTTSTTSAIPDLETGHPRDGAGRARAPATYPTRASSAPIASHADFLGVSRETPLEKTLFAVDELIGLRRGRARTCAPRASTG